MNKVLIIINQLFQVYLFISVKFKQNLVLFLHYFHIGFFQYHLLIRKHSFQLYVQIVYKNIITCWLTTAIWAMGI